MYNIQACFHSSSFGDLHSWEVYEVKGVQPLPQVYLLNHLGLQSRFADKLLRIRVGFLRNATAGGPKRVEQGVTHLSLVNNFFHRCKSSFIQQITVVQRQWVWFSSFPQNFHIFLGRTQEWIYTPGLFGRKGTATATNKHVRTRGEAFYGRSST